MGESGWVGRTHRGVIDPQEYLPFFLQTHALALAHSFVLWWGGRGVGVLWWWVGEVGGRVPVGWKERGCCFPSPKRVSDGLPCVPPAHPQHM